MDDPVRRALADLAEATRHAPPHLERSVLDAFDRQKEHGSLERRAAEGWTRRRTALGAAVFAAVIITAFLERRFVSLPSRVTETPVQPPATRPEQPKVPEARERPLTSAPAVPRQSARPRTQPHRAVQSKVDRAALRWKAGDDFVYFVHARVPRTMLPLLGVPIMEPDTPGTVGVEVLVGHDGLARAIRIVP